MGDIEKAFMAAVTDPGAETILLHGGDVFCGGTDIHDFEGRPERLDAIRSLQNRIEDSPKPVVAAIEGVCLGGGLELALACHYRIASVGSRLGFPEITLGLLPGGGGTQRAPRLLGAEQALGLMLSGKLIQAAEAEQTGLVDQVVDGAALSGAMSAIEAGAFKKPRSTGAMPVPQDISSSVDAARQRRGLSTAGKAIIDCVTQLPICSFREGLDFEAGRFAELIESDTSKALRHGFFGRRLVSKVVTASKARPAAIEEVCVVGGGLMGKGIALAVLGAGKKVTLIEPDEMRRHEALESIQKSIHREEDKGRITRNEARQRLASLSMGDEISCGAEADLFIEAVFESAEVKKLVFEELDKVAKPGAILASNTSTLDLNAIAAYTTRPEDVVGLHFFSPANIMRLLEVVRGAKTSDATLARAMAFAKAIGKTGVVAGVCDGFIGNRIMEEYLRQAWFLLEEGALPAQIDKAIESFGMAMGPCRVMDLAGQDIGWNIRKRRAVEQPDRPYSKVPDLICELGRFGQKTGAGFYKYPDGRTPEVDPEVNALIEAHSAELGLDRRKIDDSEIVERCIYAMVNEGAKVVEERIASRPVDVDIVYLEGYGFPASRGGPMFHADLVGLSEVLERIKFYEQGRHGWAWEPAQLLTRLVSEGRNLQELNQ